MIVTRIVYITKEWSAFVFSTPSSSKRPLASDELSEITPVFRCVRFSKAVKLTVRTSFGCSFCAEAGCRHGWLLVLPLTLRASEDCASDDSQRYDFKIFRKITFVQHDRPVEEEEKNHCDSV